MRHLRLALGIAMLAGLSACGSSEPTETTVPIVTYTYTDEDDFEEAAARAEDFCEEKYDREARLLDRERDSYGFEASFACE